MCSKWPGKGRGQALEQRTPQTLGSWLDRCWLSIQWRSGSPHHRLYSCPPWKTSKGFQINRLPILLLNSMCDHGSRAKCSWEEEKQQQQEQCSLVNWLSLRRQVEIISIFTLHNWIRILSDASLTEHIDQQFGKYKFWIPLLARSGIHTRPFGYFASDVLMTFSMLYLRIVLNG